MFLKARIIYLLVVSLAVQVAFSSDASAFMTFAGFGGAIHGGILKDALAPLGVNDKNLSLIQQGTDSQDIPFSHKFTSSPQNHCDDNQVKEGHAYWTSRVAQAIADSKQAADDRKLRDKALFEFGEGMHTLQDFYSHSNYVEWLLQANKPLEPVDWDNMPPAICTGYYYYAGPLANDTFCKRDKAIRKLQEKDPALKFHTADEYKLRSKSESYLAALAYVLCPEALLHRELNKDGPSTMQGRIMVAQRATTLHALARQLATADTARQWKNFEQSIISRYGDDSTKIIAALKHDK